MIAEADDMIMAMEEGREVDILQEVMIVFPGWIPGSADAPSRGSWPGISPFFLPWGRGGFFLSAPFFMPVLGASCARAR